MAISRLEAFALGSLVTALFVMGLKFMAWQMTGSVALLSDALESIVNVLAAGIAFGSVRYARKPPDDTHPFGHHKVEYVSAVIEGMLVLLAAGLIMHAAGKTLLAGPVIPDLSAAAYGVVIAGGAINAALAFVLIREGRAARSPALVADGMHVWADVLSSAAVLAGLVLASATGLAWLDPALAGLVALNILWQGWKLISSSVDGLMDHAVDAETQASIEAAISAAGAGALGAHDLKTRVAGRATFIEFHLTVDGAMPVAASHAICDRLEAALAAAVPKARVTIHVEPAGAKPHGRTLTLAPTGARE
ncbi:MAG: cation diffusion facilitator family transporter [Rhizobiaceae bacterium]|jgi:cation diffusion facilitator family transporter|nr:cation diffusion facilitator family transporter [Rhizobiaceae bacterium]